MNGDKVESRIGTSYEVCGAVYRLENAYRCVLNNEVRRMRRYYAWAELLWYWSGEDSISRLTPFAPSYTYFSDDGRTAYGAYGKRGLSLHDLNKIVKILAKSPNSRQAVTAIWNRVDILKVLEGESKDIPCTVSLQFIRRNDQLNCITTMRSNDVWLGLPYDLFCFAHIQMLVASELGIEVGWLQHQVGSLHLYDKHLAKAEKAVNSQAISSVGQPLCRNMAQSALEGLESVLKCPNDYKTQYPSTTEILQCVAHHLNEEIEEPNRWLEISS